MAWQDMFAGSTARIDAEYEQELHLADQARLGADWALGALIARYQPTVSRYLTRLTGNPPRAQQLSEQIFLRMERRLHGPHGGQHLRLWLLRACTESGLDDLRRPHRTAPHAQLGTSQPRALLPELGQTNEMGRTGRADRVRSGLEALADKTGTTRRQLRQMIWADRQENRAAEYPTDGSATGQSGSWDDADLPGYEDEEVLQPHEALRYRMIRAVLAELPYGDAQCLALHLVANLNQAEVARALGITASATRRRIVEGLQLFAQRYEAATASLGIAIGALDGERTEDMSEALQGPDGSREGEPSFPAQREPIVVSARLDTRPPVETTEESTIIWDLPPFDDLVDAAATQPVTSEGVAEVAESYPVSAASLSPSPEAGGAVPKYAEDERAEEDTRRLIWSRPVAYRKTPIGSGDEVTIRLPHRPFLSSQIEPTDNKEDKEELLAEGGAAVEVETMTEPPPAALVVDADGPSGPIETESYVPRTVPILTTANVTSPGNGDRLVPVGSGIPRGEAREISVLTPDSSMSPEPDQLYSGSADQYQSS